MITLLTIHWYVTRLASRKNDTDFPRFKYDGWTSEEVYDEIHKKAEENEELEQMGELLDEHVDWEKAQEG